MSADVIPFGTRAAARPRVSKAEVEAIRAEVDQLAPGELLGTAHGLVSRARRPDQAEDYAENIVRAIFCLARLVDVTVPSREAEQ